MGRINESVVYLFKLFTQSLRSFIGESCYPQTALDYPADRLELIFGARVNESKEVLNNRGRGSVTFKVHERLSLARAGNLRRLLCVVGKVMDV